MQKIHSIFRQGYTIKESKDLHGRYDRFEAALHQQENATAVRGIDGLPLCMMQGIGQEETVYLGHVARADCRGTNDLVIVIDAQECRAGHVGNTRVVEHADGVPFQQKAVRSS